MGRHVFAGFLVVKTTVKTGKSSRVLIVTCLLKLSNQWVKYALGCIYTDLPIGELKKKRKRRSSFKTLLRSAAIGDFLFST